MVLQLVERTDRWCMNPFAGLLDPWLGGDARVRVEERDVPVDALMRHACAVADQLSLLGVDHSSRVATVMDNSTEAIAVWFASAIRGCLEIPLNTHYSGALLTYLLRDSRAEVVCCDAPYLDTVLAAAAGTEVRHVLFAGAGPDSLATRSGDVVVEALASAAGTSATHPKYGEQSAGVVLYTSGTTGPSKGVHHSQEACVELARAVAGVNEYTPADTLLNFFPLYHQNARYTGVAAALAGGCGFQLDRTFSSSRFWRICRNGNITVFNYLGSVLTMILKASRNLDAAEARNHAVRLAWGAGAPRDVWNSFESRFGVALTEVYGLTEAPMATINRSSDPSPTGSAGRESALFEVQVQRPDGLPAEVGDVGEICLRPKRPNIFMRGYLNKHAETVAATRDLWFRTGDSGWLNSDRDLFFTDRVKDAIRRRGENISAWEVESVLLAQPEVTDCAVYAVRPEGSDEDEVMAALVLQPGADAAEVIERTAGDLPSYAVPRFVRVLPTLPRTATQKVAKTSLRADGVTPEAFDYLGSRTCAPADDSRDR
jgi:crotonobetaine/carnitine-CoA ligase